MLHARTNRKKRIFVLINQGAFRYFSETLRYIIKTSAIYKIKARSMRKQGKDGLL